MFLHILNQYGDEIKVINITNKIPINIAKDLLKDISNKQYDSRLKEYKEYWNLPGKPAPNVHRLPPELYTSVGVISQEQSLKSLQRFANGSLRPEAVPKVVRGLDLIAYIDHLTDKGKTT